jgi:phospholipase C
MLTLENRSLDSVLGWLYADDAPPHVTPEGSSSRFDGIPASASNGSRGRTYRPQRGTTTLAEPCRTPRWDPNEKYEHVVRQLHADGDGRMPAEPWHDASTMEGFACDYDALYVDPTEVMGAYDEDQLPVLYGLARRFAVSDRWFSSVPTQTNANRAFSICGTSLGGVDNGDTKTYDTRTIFDALTGHKSWGVYWQWDGFQSGDPGPKGGCYTADVFPHIRDAVERGDGEMGTYASFLDTVRAGGDIPQFCYLEPFWGCGKGYLTGNDFAGVQGNDYHPPAFIGPAEHDLAVLYDALRTSRQWANMLFIVTFDEHGGSYDHVAPPRTVAPDHHVATPSGAPSFDFTTLGVRVPTILATPFVEPGTVFRAPTGSTYDFDHTSFIATLLKWAGLDPATAGLGARVAVAPTFEAILTDVAHPDTDAITVPDGYATQGGGVGLHLGLHLADLDPSGLSVEVWRHLSERSADVDEFVGHLRRASKGADAP